MSQCQDVPKRELVELLIGVIYSYMSTSSSIEKGLQISSILSLCSWSMSDAYMYRTRYFRIKGHRVIHDIICRTFTKIPHQPTKSRNTTKSDSLSKHNASTRTAKRVNTDILIVHLENNSISFRRVVRYFIKLSFNLPLLKMIT